MSMQDFGQPSTDGKSELEKFLKHEQVLLPFLSKSRSKLYGCGEQSRRFIHYTSAESAFKIIKSREFWLRNVRCMNDYLEVTHGCNSIKKHLDSGEIRQKLQSTMDDIAKGAFASALSDFKRWMEAGHLNLGTYIGSLSEHPDEEDKHGRLSMWRAYGGTTGCVGIVLKIPRESQAASELGVAFNPVAYMGEDKVRCWLHGVADRCQEEAGFLRSLGYDGLRQAIIQMLVIAATCIKHEGFIEEREWRLVHIPGLTHEPKLRSEHEVIGGIPQRVFITPAV